MIWSKCWPTEAGHYWFYGWRSHQSSEPALHHAQVREIASGPIYIADGHFLYRSEGARGVWYASPTPEIPSDEQFAVLMNPMS